MADASVTDLFDRADVVFRGTVRRVAASTMPEVPASEKTAVVKVEEVIDAPVSFPGLVGSDITVALAEPVEKGQQFIFLANTWLFGSSIAVQEVGRTSAEEPEARSAVVGEISEAARSGARSAVRRRMDEADAVIAGRVTLVRPSQAAASAAARESRPVTEHDPQWQEAVVEVESVVRGAVRAQQVTILFPGSMDVMWRDAPKHRPGERGVWFLHQDPVPAAVAEVVPQVFAVVDKHDFQSRDRLEEIREVAQEVEE